MGRSLNAEARPEIILQSAPVLGNISEETWAEFRQAVSSTTGICERDTEAEMFLHVVAQTEQPMDVRKRALWELGHNQGLNGLSLGIHDSADGSFFESASRALEESFTSSGALLRYGTELGLEFYESGKHKQWNVGDDHSAALLLGVATPLLSSEPQLMSRAISAIAGTDFCNAGGAREDLMGQTVARVLLDKRVPNAQREDLLRRVKNYNDGNPRHSTQNHKVLESAQAATELFDPDVHDPTFLRKYYNELANKINADPEESRRVHYRVPAGLESIDKLETLLGPDHPYIELVVAQGLFNTHCIHPSADEDEIKKALQASQSLNSPTLRDRATAVVQPLWTREVEHHAKYAEQTANAVLVVNRFFRRESLRD